MGVDLNGFEELDKTLKRKYSSKAINEAERRAIKAGGHMLRNKIESGLLAIGDTGILARGTTLKEPEIIGGEVVGRLHWKGSHASLAHLNEKGHYDKAGKWVKPTGMGKVSQTLMLNREDYFKLIKKELDK